MNETPIRKNTIVSTTDKRLTLLQWLKQVQGQLKDLKDKGVKAVVEEFDTPEAFYNAYSTKPAGTPVLAIVGSDTAIYGTLNEFTDKVNVKGFIYQGGKVYTSAEADALSIVGAGGMGVDEFATPKDFHDAYFGKEIGTPVLAVVGKTNMIFGTIASTTLANTVYVVGISFIDDEMSSGAYCNPTQFYGASYNFVKENDLNLKGVHTYFARSGGSNSDPGGGIRIIGSSSSSPNRLKVIMGVFRSFSGSIKSTDYAQGIIFDVANNEVYYPVNGFITCTYNGEIGNAISGTQLKEAVQRATQKTYWHSVKIKGANGIFTFNAPSTINTPVVSTEKLLELFNNGTWSGFGKLGTDMLFAISLLNGNIEFIKADDTKVSIGAFGTIDISDDVKEVK